jgi:hypothetical protein
VEFFERYRMLSEVAQQREFEEAGKRVDALRGSVSRVIDAIAPKADSSSTSEAPAAQQGVPEPNPLLASAKRALRLLESNGAGAWAAAVELRKGIESAEASLLPEPVTAASSKRPRVR